MAYFKTVSFFISLKKKFLLSVVGRRWWKTFSFFLSQSCFFNICVIYHRRFSQYTATKTTKTYPLIHSLWHNKRNKNFSFSHKTSSLCVVGPVMYFPFLSLSLSSLCVIYPRGRSVHSSKRVTTGPNGLQHNGLERVPTGSNGFDGGGRKGQWHVYYLHNTSIILFISFI